MINELAFKNLKRSASNYLIYVITVTLLVALMFSYHSMMFSRNIREMNPGMNDYFFLLIMFSILVFIITGWLINYMTGFMLNQRSKEFGLYRILGMTGNQIIRIFYTEQSLMAAISLVIGIIVGWGLFQGLNAVMAALFGQEFNFELAVSLESLLITILGFIGLMLLSLNRQKKKLRGKNLKTLLLHDRINESIRNNSPKRSLLFFALFLASIAVIAFVRSIPIVFLALIILIYSFNLGCIGTLELVMDHSKTYKYRNNRLFIIKQLASKVNTLGFTLGTLSLLITLSLLLTSFSFSLNKVKDNIDGFVPFDIALTSIEREGDPLSSQREWLSTNGWVSQDLTYKIYEGEDDQFRTVLDEGGITGGYFTKTPLIALSDYNELRWMLGKDPVNITEGSYIMQADRQTGTLLQGLDFSLSGSTYAQQEFIRDDFSQNGLNGAGFVVVVSDDIARSRPIYYNNYVAQTDRTTDDALDRQLRDMTYIDSDYWGVSRLDHGYGVDNMYAVYHNVLVRDGGIHLDAYSIIITMVSSLFYIALVFICVALTILAVQHLSDGGKMSIRFDVVGKLGVSERKKVFLLLRYLLLSFLLPLILPIILTYIATLFVDQFMFRGDAGYSTLTSFRTALVMFGAVYATYFTATFIGLKKFIIKKSA